MAGENGQLDALVGTKWLLGPVRIRQERSLRKSSGDCRASLTGAFGEELGGRLDTRGIQCTKDWNKDEPTPDFLDFTKPLSVLGICDAAANVPDACAAANADRAACTAAGACTFTAGAPNTCVATTPVDCTDGNGDEEGCSAAAPSCAFRKLAFRDAFRSGGSASTAESAPSLRTPWKLAAREPTAARSRAASTTRRSNSSR